MAWALLILGGLFEVGFTTCLRFVDGFRNLPWTLGFLASVTLSMGLLEVASRSIPFRPRRGPAGRPAVGDAAGVPVAPRGTACPHLRAPPRRSR